MLIISSINGLILWYFNDSFNGILTGFHFGKCVLPLKMTINRTIFNGFFNDIFMVF